MQCDFFGVLSADRPMSTLGILYGAGMQDELMGCGVKR